MKILILFAALLTSLSVLGQRRYEDRNRITHSDDYSGIEFGVGLGTNGSRFDWDGKIGIVAEEEKVAGSLRLLLPLEDELSRFEHEQDIADYFCNDQSFDEIGYNCAEASGNGGKSVGIEFLGVYKINDNLGVGGVFGVYRVNSPEAAITTLGPAARLKLIQTKNSQMTVEGRYDLLNRRWEMGASISSGKIQNKWRQ